MGTGAVKKRHKEIGTGGNLGKVQRSALTVVGGGVHVTYVPCHPVYPPCLPCQKKAIDQQFPSLSCLSHYFTKKRHSDLVPLTVFTLLARPYLFPMLPRCPSGVRRIWEMRGALCIHHNARLTISRPFCCFAFGSCCWRELHLEHIFAAHYGLSHYGRDSYAKYLVLHALRNNCQRG